MSMGYLAKKTLYSSECLKHAAYIEAGTVMTKLEMVISLVMSYYIIGNGQPEISNDQTGKFNASFTDIYSFTIVIFFHFFTISCNNLARFPHSPTSPITFYNYLSLSNLINRLRLCITDLNCIFYYILLQLTLRQVW